MTYRRVASLLSLMYRLVLRDLRRRELSNSPGRTPQLGLAGGFSDAGESEQVKALEVLQAQGLKELQPVRSGRQMHQVEKSLLGSCHERRLTGSDLDMTVSAHQGGRQVTVLETPEWIAPTARAAEANAGRDRYVFRDQAMVRQGGL